MPLYYFNVRIADDLLPDHDGIALRNPDEAWVAARSTIREILADEEETPAMLTAVMVVTDEEGDTVLEFPFSEAMLDLPSPSQTKH